MTNKLNGNSYNMAVLIIFTAVLILYVNYDLELFKKMENFQNDINDLDTNKIAISENIGPSSTYVYDQRKAELINLMGKFNKLQVPINVDDNGVICNQWANDPDQRYPNLDNNYCQLKGQQTYCLNNKNDLTTCNKLYSKEIQKMATIDTESLIRDGLNKLKYELSRMDKDIERKQTDLDDTLNRLISKKNIANQQQFFIKQNSNRLSESKNIKNEMNKKYHNATNEYEMSKYHVNKAKKEIDELHNTNNILNKIITGISVILIILVIISLLLTRVY